MSLKLAKSLARTAGLKVKEDTLPRSEMEQIESYFQALANDIFLAPTPEEENKRNAKYKEIEQAIEQAYSDRRRERYNMAMQVKYARNQTGKSTRRLEDGKTITAWRVQAEIPGFYVWTYEGKTHQSWFGDRTRAILPPKSIGGYLAGRYPGHDITIVQAGVVSSRQFVPEGAEPIVCPKYNVTITKKLPGWYLTAERLLLEGRLLDVDAAKELWSKYELNELTQQDYAEQLAKLCRAADKFDDEPPTGYVSLDDTGRFIEREPEDRPSFKTDDPTKDHEEHRRLWDDEDELFDDLEDELAIALTLGLRTEQIEFAEDVGDTTEEFLRAAYRTPRKASLPQEGEAIEGW